MDGGKILEVFYDYNCPWCYLGTANTDRLRLEREIAICWTLFPLHPEVSMEGMELTDLFPGRTEQLEASKGRLREAAAATVGLPVGEVWDVLSMELFAPAVDEDWLRARQMGVTVVPFYLYGEKPLVGYRPYEELLRLVDED